MWAALTWLFSAAPSWDSSHGLAARSVPARSVSPPGTRCQPYSHMDDLWTFHTSPPLGPSCIIRSQQVSDQHEANFVPGAISYIESLYIRQNKEKGWQKFSVCIDRKLVNYCQRPMCNQKALAFLNFPYSTALTLLHRRDIVSPTNQSWYTSHYMIVTLKWKNGHFCARCMTHQ